MILHWNFTGDNCYPSWRNQLWTGFEIVNTPKIDVSKHISRAVTNGLKNVSDVLAEYQSLYTVSRLFLKAMLVCIWTFYETNIPMYQ